MKEIPQELKNELVVAYAVWVGMRGNKHEDREKLNVVMDFFDIPNTQWRT